MAEQQVDISSWEFGELINEPHNHVTILRTAATSIICHDAAWPIPEEAKNLILAAPDLLEACEDIYKSVKGLTGEQVAKLSAAIAKAKP